MKWLTIISFLICCSVSSQNLIPNPGFEEVLATGDYQWIQPQGPYYHYEITDSLSQHEALSGSYVNGLCMYNNRENEYLHVKLLRPLQAGKTYQLKFYARLMRAKCFNYQLQQLIGVHFGEKRLDTHIPGDLYLKPQLNLELPDTNRFEWFELSGNYEAKGGEEYLTLGYFAATQAEELRRKENLPIKRVQKDEKNDEDKSWLYLPPDEQKKFIKAQKKKRRKNKKKEAALPDFSKPQSELIEYPETGSDSDVIFFQVRYYFDDFCLAAIPDSGKVDCTSISEGQTLARGKTLTLQNVFFETDQAVLRQESFVQLEVLYEVLKRQKDMAIEIHGYTDDQGEKQYNLKLSQERAEAVVNWLTQKGIEGDRLQARGFGEADPVASNETEAGRTLNRRVEFLIVDM